MENSKKLIAFLILAAIIGGYYFLWLSAISNASPISKASLDGNGCHSCQKVCEKFGVEKGENHCHIFAPEANQIMTRAGTGSAANDEAMFSQNVLAGLDYISVAPDKSRLLIGPTRTKKIAGQYTVVNHSCGYGIKPVSLKEGKPGHMSRAFGVPVSNGDGIYTLTIEGRPYLAIATGNRRLLVIDQQDRIVCGGEFQREKFYLYCQGSVINPRTTWTTGYCRTSLIRQ